jgi:nitronate monooxygenase
MREAAAKDGKTDRMQMWAGQAAKMASTEPAGDVAAKLWRDAEGLLYC